MKPIEKAIELVNIFSRIGLQQRDEGIECAKICVDEILKELENKNITSIFWQNVKYEIENL